MYTESEMMMSSGTWTALPPMRTNRRFAAAARVGTKIYVFGGNDDRNVLASVEAFDIVSGTWTALPPMSTKRSGLAAACVGTKIYVR